MSAGIQPAAKNRGGAPKGNANALRSGRYSKKARYSHWKGVSRDRPDLADIEASCESLRLQVEQAILTARPGTMTLEDASACDVAVGAVFVAELARRHIVSGALDPALEVAFAKDYLAAMQVRHRFVKALNLNVQVADPESPEAVYKMLRLKREGDASE
jgi:hypothetical protein